MAKKKPEKPLYRISNFDGNSEEEQIPKSLLKSVDSRLPSHIIIDCSMFSYVDAAGINTLTKIACEYESIGIKIMLANVAPHVNQMLEAADFFIDVPSHQVYISGILRILWFN